MKRQSINLWRLYLLYQNTIYIFSENNIRDRDKWKETWYRKQTRRIFSNTGLVYCEIASVLLGVECSRKSLNRATRKSATSSCQLSNSSVAENINVLPLSSVWSWQERSAKFEMSISYTFIRKLSLNMRRIKSFLYRGMIKIIEI